MQLTPQLLNYQDLLHLVDWDTIVVYTCPNEKCLPHMADNQFIVEEFAFVQFSEDFDQVQYGTEEEIKQRKQQQVQQQAQAESAELTQEEQAEIEKLKAEQEEKARKKSEKNKRRKEKKKEKAAQAKEESQQIQAQVKSELTDLMAEFNLQGAKPAEQKP